MYTSTWSLSLELGHLSTTYWEMRESVVALRERVEAELDR